MTRFSRRETLLGAGLVTAGGRIALGQDPGSEQVPKIRQVLESLKLSEDQRRQYQILDSLDQVPVAFTSEPESATKTIDVDAIVEEVKDGKGRRLAVALRWTCEANVLNNLQVAGQPLQARTFSFGVQNISWQAGRGWPVYHVHCPRDDYGDMYYRHAKVHQIVPSIVDANYFVGCASSATCTGRRSGRVRFAVNDSSRDYGDNQGTFEVVIYSYS